MAASKKKKREIKQGGHPHSREVFIRENPDAFYREHPSWRFSRYDHESDWTFDANTFLNKILPYLRNMESKTWGEIFVKEKKQNHAIDVRTLTTAAQKRLGERNIEIEALHSLRLGGKIRLYGLMFGSTFHILWYDENHGEDDTCVCQSRKKHT